ncbi:mediator of RNA polymerase II transcription subunit 24 [Drosophila simulans]|uniref:Mediator of RNA polymerase II transcription subunit 24 n=1 Tax=Drosophila simulans TaxID=7240 RepID=B4QLJ5_DROSI|nr:mediator of RNA polymerase II transcription subunit 24 [Drosophila simulans]EDX09655.1 Trap100 [Drosophila simulans]KMY98309.1 Trap100 [Drosophila simulans]
MKENNKILQLIYVAWRERWTDSQWGINIKKVLPRGVSGDVYNLADCLMQQALIGSTANPLVLNYLKHSLCAHLVSHAAVLRCIAKYDKLERVYCITALLEFLASIVDGVTCRIKSEEAVLPSSVVHLVYWLLQIFARTVQHYELYGEISAEQSYMLDQTCVVIDRLSQQQFLLSMLYVGCHEELEICGRIRDKYATIKGSLTNSNFTLNAPQVEQQLQQLAFIEAKHLEMQTLNPPPTLEKISCCVQPLLAVEVLLNPCKDTSYYVAELQMLQRLKKYSNTRLFYEIIRAGFLTLSNVADTSPDTMWGAFMFFKMPHIIKQLHALQRIPGEQPPPADYIPELVEALELLIEDNLLLDFMDTKCSCNMIEFLLNDWTKQQLVNDVHVKKFASQREAASQLLKKCDNGQQTPSNINFIKRAEVPLSGVLKTLCTNKVQDMVNVLCQVPVGNSFELILSVATVEGRLKTFVSRLIQCNENSKPVPGELGKLCVIRSTLFDVSFLMLTSIVQTYGSDVVLSERGDSFFEKWVRECMVERNKLKNPRQILALCDDSIVDELLLSFSKPEAAQLKANNLSWQETCLNLPGVLHHVLIAWEQETLSSADVKSILDNIKRRLFSFSVCATSFLCAYMYSVKETELLKPLNMIQQFLAPLTSEELSSQENAKERLALSYQIIRKMQHDVHPAPSTKSRLISHSPLVEQFREVWRTVVDAGHLPVRAAQSLESLLLAGGAAWLSTQLVEQLLACKYTRDMSRTMDVVFAVMHLDIEKTTEALLQYVVAPLILRRQGEDINEPQSLVLARLCVYCIISCLESRKGNGTSALTAMKKRSRSHDEEELAANAAKVRKVIGDGSDNSSDFTDTTTGAGLAALLGSTSTSELRTTPLTLREPLQTSVQHIFAVFLQFVSGDELSPKAVFVYQFISLLVECGGERVAPVLRLLPNGLVQQLLKVLVTDDIKVGLISRLYDLRIQAGRLSAVSDLCLWRNMQMARHSIHL